MSQIIADTYEIEKKIGAGGGGNVYLARHLRLQKNVVLKVDKRKLSTRQEILRREVDVLKELNNPYIPQVYDFFVEEDNVYTVMDYIEGESLDKALKRGEKFSQAQVIRWACQLLDALCYLHSPIHGDPPKGYVHSDIKPANLMRTMQGDICLIDFNIALALGEENVIGCSAGYASPEHYGLDFSSRYEEAQDSQMERKSNLPEGETATVTIAKSFTDSVSSSSSLRKKMIIPDIRSDIYSVGATLYHLLNGKRPSKNAKEVARLSEELFNPQIVRIISKAMDPNPDLRYQTADEMKQDFLNLHKNDPRMRRWRKQRRIASVLLPAVFLIGGLLAFTGLKRMQMMERWLKLNEYSQTALAEGDVEKALQYSLEVLTESSDSLMPEHVQGAQTILTQALGVYDLSDGYKMHKIVELPASPVCMVLSPNGETGAALCGQKMYIFDTFNSEVITELSLGESPVSEAKYLNEDTLIYAGERGLTAYDIKKKNILWTGDSATAISISGDGKSVAGICEGQSYATIYDADTGETKYEIDFNGKCQNIGIKDNLFALNGNGTLLGVSFKDGSLQIFDLEHPDKETTIFKENSGYIHYEGGFCGEYFAFSAFGEEESIFVVIDTVKEEEAGGFHAETNLGVQTDETGIYVQSGNVLVRLNPVTGEQTPIVTMSENILRFATDAAHTVAASENEIFFFDKNAQLLSRYKKKYQSDLLCIAGGMAVAGSMDKPVIRVVQYQERPETEVFSYDPGYHHNEARISEDGKTVMLFSYEKFRIYDSGGTLVSEVDIPDSEHVLDQQFVRKESESYLEVIYDNGNTNVYSANNGELLRRETNNRTIENLDEKFEIDNFYIESPLHGTPIVYDSETGKEIARLKEDTYLTYVTKVDKYLVAQYVTAEGEVYGQLLNDTCEVLAELPYLSDVCGELLVFDYPVGSIRTSQVYELEELIDMASK